MTPVLVVVTDFARPEALERIRKVALGARLGTVLVQLRDHGLSIKKRYELGLELRRLLEDSGQHFAVNDRVDLALALGAGALHLGERSISTADARVLAPGIWISRACHRVGEVSDLDADAVLLSPIVEARHGRPALGLSAVSEARDRVGGTKRIYAFGGVSERTARACLESGADGVAVMGAVLDTEDTTPLLEVLGIRR